MVVRQRVAIKRVQQHASQARVDDLRFVSGPRAGVVHQAAQKIVAVAPRRVPPQARGQDSKRANVGGQPAPRWRGDEAEERPDDDARRPGLAGKQRQEDGQPFALDIKRLPAPAG